jgi:hypothetical protein
MTLLAFTSAFGRCIEHQGEGLLRTEGALNRLARPSAQLISLRPVAQVGALALRLVDQGEDITIMLRLSVSCLSCCG